MEVGRDLFPTLFCFLAAVYTRLVVLGRLLCKIFLGSKMGPFHKRQKNIILRDPKRSSFITDYSELQFDTPTLIIPSFRMTG